MYRRGDEYQDTIKQEQNVYFIPVQLLAFINIVN